MKSKDIVKQHGIDKAAFEAWLPSSGYSFKTSALGGVDVDESQDIGAIVGAFKEYYADWQRAEQQRQEAAAQARTKEAEDAKRAADEKQRALASMLITSGFSFDGYTITKYSGYISGDDAVSVARTEGFWGTTATDVGDALMKSLVKIRRQALLELKEAAYALGCNAVIGVDFDYLTLDPVTGNSQVTKYLPYVFGVTANGNAVIIEKNDRVAGVQ